MIGEITRADDLLSDCFCDIRLHTYRPSRLHIRTTDTFNNDGRRPQPGAGICAPLALVRTILGRRGKNLILNLLDLDGICCVPSNGAR